MRARRCAQRELLRSGMRGAMRSVTPPARREAIAASDISLRARTRHYFAKMSAQR